MKYRRIRACVLAICILLSLLPLSAAAAGLSASDDLIEFIKECEGFTKYVHWDYQHYAVGYGTQCEGWEYPNGISEAEADRLLRQCVRDAEDSVDSFVRSKGLKPTQQQYDCMVSVTYGLGTEWMKSGYELPKRFINGCTELELLNTLGGWVTANGETLDGLILRRMSETYIYMKGVYDKETTPYACLKFNPNGGTVDNKRVYTYKGSAYGLGMKLPVPVLSGYVFAGWYDTAGNRVTDTTIATSTILTVKAKWTKPQSLFTDVSNADWFYEDVKAATELGLFNGYNDGSFQPKASMNRAMFAQVLYRIAGQPKHRGENPFADVKKTDWFYDAVCWAYQAGIVNGVSETSFAPNNRITREQMATMLFKYSALCGFPDCSVGGTLDQFRDSASISAYAVEAMQWAVDNGLINGVSAVELAPRSNATRAQAAAILVRMVGLLHALVG